MSVEPTIVCDRCAAIMAGGRTARGLASIAGTGCLVAQPGGLDYCWSCSPDVES